MTDEKKLGIILEGALLAAGKPLSIEQIERLFGPAEQPSRTELRDALAALSQDCEGRSFELVEVASGWRLQIRRDLEPWISRLWDEKPPRYSRALLETLALIAYRQPITRAEIEDVRGVAVSTHIVKTLLEREWVRVLGHRDVPGHPALYGTTRQFLDYFGLKTLDALPTLAELKDLDRFHPGLELGEAECEEEGGDLQTTGETGLGMPAAEGQTLQ